MQLVRLEDNSREVGHIDTDKRLSFSGSLFFHEMNIRKGAGETDPLMSPSSGLLQYLPFIKQTDGLSDSYDYATSQIFG